MIDVESYCRDIEAYLCRKNDGHLIRITGPAFEQVQGWARLGVPLKIAEAGIDRYFERYYRKGPRRRPVRIEFCEADVLDAFDDWRRAVGITRVTSDETGGPDAEDLRPRPRQKSLAAKIDSAVARLTVLRGSGQVPALAEAIERAVRLLDGLRGEASKARGEARDDIASRLSAIDDELNAAALAALDAPTRSAVEKEAEEALAPFRARLSSDAFAASRRQAIHGLVRERFGLPTFT